jgi:hypothetical protein
VLVCVSGITRLQGRGLIHGRFRTQCYLSIIDSTPSLQWSFGHGKLTLVRLWMLQPRHGGNVHVLAVIPRPSAVQGLSMDGEIKHRHIVPQKAELH